MDWTLTFTVIGVAIAGITLIATILLRPRAAVTFAKRLDVPLLAVHSSITQRVQVLFDGQEVRNLRLAMMEIRNAGNVSITEQQFVEPIRLDFGDATDIISASALLQSKDDVPATIDLDRHRITIKPLLLNGGDCIRIVATLAGVDDPKVSGRIVGVKRVTQLEMIAPGSPDPPRVHVYVLAGQLAIVLVCVVAEWLVPRQDTIARSLILSFATVTAALGVLTLIELCLSLFRVRRAKQRSMSRA